MKGAILVDGTKKVRLKDLDPGDTRGLGSQAEALKRVTKDLDRLRELQRVLAADARYAVLVVLQAMDTGGKDGTIRHVMSGMNPAGCVVTSFKVPSSEEAAHDYLWRIHKAVPAHGMVGVFNRSHYEDVLVVRVHSLVPTKTWKARYRQINEFERHLVENRIVVLKFFLHISKDEQARRLRSRIENQAKNWKFAEADIAERKLWGDYQEAYEDAINQCGTTWAPWMVVPANKKWARDAIIARAMVEALEGLDLRYPESKLDLSKVVIK